ncbi:MAG: hypothetical protein SFZ02_07110 [bacterium]|nr:hypothetical protein [bacterium]
MIASIQKNVTWRAVLLAGIVGGIVFLLVQMLIPPAISPSLLFRYIGSLAMGSDVLTNGNSSAVVVGIVIHFSLSLVFALIITIVVHRWGLLVGIIGGAILGLALYGINLYTLTRVFPWFFAINTTSLLLSHVLFGAVAGGIYELFDHFDLPLVKGTDDDANK